MARGAATNAQVQQPSPAERSGCSGRSGISSSRPTSQQCGGSFWLGVFIRVVLHEADRAGIAFSGGAANQILTAPWVCWAALPVEQHRAVIVLGIGVAGSPRAP